MIKYVKLSNNSVGIEVLQSQGWLVLGEIVSDSEVYVKLAKIDQDHVNRLRELNPVESEVS